MMRQAAIYGAAVAAAVFFIGWTTGMGGPLPGNLVFSLAMGVFGGALFVWVKKRTERGGERIDE